MPLPIMDFFDASSDLARIVWKDSTAKVRRETAQVRHNVIQVNVRQNEW